MGVRPMGRMVLSTIITTITITTTTIITIITTSGAAMTTIRYRLFEPRLQPRRTRAQVPGWAGERVPRRDGEHEYPWHCMPFVEAAQGGIELLYPYDNELRVTRRAGQVVLEADFGPDPGTGVLWPPFRTFGELYYTYQLLLDLRVPDDMAVRTEPHPRVFTSIEDDVPVAIPALLRTAWWPMISFVVFKAPPEGRFHVFRPGEAFMQLLIVPLPREIELAVMAPDEAAERELQGRRIHASRATLGQDSTWLSATKTVFDGTYRRLLGAATAKQRSAER